ncbi:HET-domain-containing protein [Xylariaceae sp. FL1651]|nr:HET-domain-containing protein [Xylariaceae sp. FL1651]
MRGYWQRPLALVIYSLASRKNAWLFQLIEGAANRGSYISKTPLAMKLPGLCSVCEGCLLQHDGLLQAADEDDREPTWVFKAHMDVDSLTASRDAGCTICTLLWTLLSDEQAIFLLTMDSSEMLTFLLVRKDDTLSALGAADEDCWLVTTTFWEVPDEWPGEKPYINFILEPAADAMLDYLQEPGSGSTSSEATWMLALEWIDKCRTSHPDSCSGAQVGQWYPTRLLDVGKREDDCIRLIETSIVSPNCGYVTLSHCWGAAQILKLNKATATQLHRGIQPAELPLTFQHAVVVTRKLQRQYIWIDSLCIYQDEDDKSDWQKEASLMEKVYENGEFNIAATGAKDSHGGLFATRVPEIELKPTKVSWLQREYILTDWTFLERELRSAPLNKRGWVLQERLLAPRILHFGRKQLFWECNEGILCERFPTRLPLVIQNAMTATFPSLRFRKTPNRSSGVEQSISQASNLNDAYALWKDIAQTYSETAVTFSSDKLVAVSGIVKVLRKTLNDVYIVGMWRRYLASHLLWYVSDVNDGGSTRKFPYRAPTWSWLSVDSEIIFPSSRQNEGWIEVVDVDVRFSTADTTGPVSGGILILRGRLRPLQLRKAVMKRSDLGSELLEEAEAKGLSLDGFLIGFGQWVMSVGGKDLELADGEPQDRAGPVVYLDSPSPNFDDSNRRQELYIMLAGGPSKKLNQSEIHEILILKCVDKEAGRFHRIGLAILVTETSREIFDMLMQFDDIESSLPCVTYDAQKHSHTIILE